MLLIAVFLLWICLQISNGDEFVYSAECKWIKWTDEGAMNLLIQFKSRAGYYLKCFNTILHYLDSFRPYFSKLLTNIWQKKPFSNRVVLHKVGDIRVQQLQSSLVYLFWELEAVSRNHTATKTKANHRTPRGSSSYYSLVLLYQIISATVTAVFNAVFIHAGTQAH